MLILLPPSEGKTAPRRGRPLDLDRLSFRELAPARAELLAALVETCTTDDPSGLERAVEVLGIGKTLAGEVARNAELPRAATARADKVYSGVLFEALDLPSLPASARRRATSWVAITSALFGLVRPADPIPAYRLSGDVSLPRTGGTAGFWRDRLDPVVSRAAGSGVVVDLRSTTYAAFWRPADRLADRVVTVRVLHEVDGTRKVVSHFNKATKGRIVRAMLEDGGRPTSPKKLAVHLQDLGWNVELGAPGRHGTPLDVVVQDL